MKKYSIEELMKMDTEELEKVHQQKRKEMSKFHQLHWQKVANIIYMQNVMNIKQLEQKHRERAAMHLRNARAEADLTMDEAAKILGLSSKQALNFYEKGNSGNLAKMFAFIEKLESL